jgi:hypothetical protein
MAVAVAVDHLLVVVLTIKSGLAHLFLEGLAVLRLSQQTQRRVLVQQGEEERLLTALGIQVLVDAAN